MDNLQTDSIQIFKADLRELIPNIKELNPMKIKLIEEIIFNYKKKKIANKIKKYLKNTNITSKEVEYAKHTFNKLYLLTELFKLSLNDELLLQNINLKLIETTNEDIISF